MKVAISLGVLAYVVWPIDLMPGVPIDDAIVVLSGIAANKNLAQGRIAG